MTEEHIVTDYASGTKESRPGLDQSLGQLEAGALKDGYRDHPESAQVTSVAEATVGPDSITATVRATGRWDARGTLGLDKSVPGASRRSTSASTSTPTIRAWLGCWS